MEVWNECWLYRCIGRKRLRKNIGCEKDWVPVPFLFLHPTSYSYWLFDARWAFKHDI